MPRFVALSKSAHRESGLVPGGLSHALEQAVVPLVARELPQVVSTMAIAFVRLADDSGFELVALQSLQPGVNVYVHTNGRWIGGYKPAWYRSYPFRLASDESGERRVVCVDEESSTFEHTASDDAIRLFDNDGEPTQRTRELISFLENLENAKAVTQALVNNLDEAGLIVPWKVTANSGEGQSGQEVKGLYHVDEAAMKALAPEVVAGLVGSGALSIAYTQLLSEHRLQGLARLYELRAAAKRKSEATEDVDLEELFADDDDNLTF